MTGSAVDAGICFFRADCRDIDSLGSLLVPQRNFPDRILPNVAIAERLQELTIAASASHLEQSLFQKTWRGIPELGRAGRQHKQIRATGFERLQNRQRIDQGAIEAVSAINVDKTVIEKWHSCARLQQREQRRRA